MLERMDFSNRRGIGLNGAPRATAQLTSLAAALLSRLSFDQQPFHLGPVVIIEEVQAGSETSAVRLERLIRRYWGADSDMAHPEIHRPIA